MDSSLFKKIYRIPTTRLPKWNYSSAGWYYVTICTKDKICYFGIIKDRKITLSVIGRLARKFWEDIPKHFTNVRLDEYIIMPNHIHGIIVINKCRDVINHVSTKNISPMGKGTLGEMVRWFKGRVSYDINNFLNKQFSWQSRFYDHIIRNEQSLLKIREYIRSNHLKWDFDEENPKHL